MKCDNLYPNIIYIFFLLFLSSQTVMPKKYSKIIIPSTASPLNCYQESFAVVLFVYFLFI